jgi:hypothetical protein
MKYVLNKSHWLIKNPTLFSVISPIVVIIAILYVVYLSIYQNGGELGGAILLLLILLAAAIFAFDRVFAKFFNNKMISLVELIVCVLVLYFILK